MEVHTPWRESAKLPADEAARAELLHKAILQSVDMKLGDLPRAWAELSQLRQEHLVDVAGSIADRMIAAISTTNVWDDRIGPFYSAATVSTLLEISRQAVHKRMQRRQLLGMPVGGDVVYPTFQFRGKDPLPHLHEVLTRLDPENRDRWGDALWLLTPLDTEDGPTPIDLLWAEGAGRTVRERNLSRVLAEAAEAGAFWAS